MPDSPTACVDRDLLRRAWPAGCLAVPGLATVTGLRCIGFDGERPWFGRWRVFGDGFGDYGNVERLIAGPRCADGDYLPLVDPTDVASWFIVLCDLAVAAEAAGIVSLLHRPLTGFDFCCWAGEKGDRPPGTRHFILTVHDPAGRNFVDFYLPVGDLVAHGWVDKIDFEVQDGRAWSREKIALAFVFARIAVREKGF